MAEAEAEAEVGGGERFGAGVELADHWIIYTLVITLFVLVWINILYWLAVRFGWTGLASFVR